MKTLPLIWVYIEAWSWDCYFRDDQECFGPHEWSTNIIRRLEELAGVEVLGKGLPAELTDDEPEEKRYEVVVTGLD